MNYRKLFLGLGSNLGDRIENIKIAIEHIKKYFIVKSISPFYETEPVGPSQPFFVNTVVECETNLEPYEVLLKVKYIEKIMGRKTEIKWGPRNIDIDILIIEGCKVQENDLVIPHKELKNRRFFLEPLFYLGVNYIIEGKTVLYFLNKSLEQFCEKI